MGRLNMVEVPRIVLPHLLSNDFKKRLFIDDTVFLVYLELCEFP